MNQMLVLGTLRYSFHCILLQRKTGIARYLIVTIIANFMMYSGDGSFPGVRGEVASEA